MTQTGLAETSTVAVTRQTRRAWAVLITAFLLFLLLAAGAAGAVRFYYQHATRAEVAGVDVISGAGALWRTGPDAEWTLIDENTRLREGNQVSTALGTVVWVTLFDGSTIEVSEDTVMTIDRMRSSRYLHRTKHIVLELERGTVYAAMEPHGEYTYSEFTVQAYGATATMADGRGHNGAGSFLVEARPLLGADANTEHEVRAAALEGRITVESASDQQALTGNEQVVVQPDGTIGATTAAVRELITNGDFGAGLSDWVTVHDESTRSEPVASTVELVSETVHGDPVVAVEFLRAPGTEVADQTGIRQRIGQTLRVYSSLQLQFNVKISSQDPAGGGEGFGQFPFQVELNYVDVNGEERQWTRGYYIVDDAVSPVPANRGAKLDRGEWQQVVFDLRNISPLPKQITSVVLYASGYSYQTRVANVSLTSSELEYAGN